jgi:hypothetical protein
MTEGRASFQYKTKPLLPLRTPSKPARHHNATDEATQHPTTPGSTLKTSLTARQRWRYLPLLVSCTPAYHPVQALEQRLYL